MEGTKLSPVGQRGEMGASGCHQDAELWLLLFSLSCPRSLGIVHKHIVQH